MLSIEEIQTKPVELHATVRSNLKIVYKNNTPQIKQIIISKTFPNSIKAFHMHKQQTDYWYVISGNIRAVVSNEKETNEIFLGDDYEDKILCIPPKIWHGYEVIGNEPAVLLYMLTETYNPKDEFRKPFNAFFDWKGNKQ